MNFQVENSDGDDVSARIYVGHYETRVSPIADTNPATSGLNLDDTAKFAPGTYELIVHAPGYGHSASGGRSSRARATSSKFELPRNWASLTSGATATTTDGAATVNSLIDDTEGNVNWAAPATNVGGASSVDGKTATIDLGGTDDVKVRYVQVSAHLSRSELLRGPALIRAVGVQRRQGRQLHERRRLRQGVYESRGRLPG